MVKCEEERLCSRCSYSTPAGALYSSDLQWNLEQWIWSRDCLIILLGVESQQRFTAELLKQFSDYNSRSTSSRTTRDH